MQQRAAISVTLDSPFHEAVLSLIACIGSPRFGVAALESINRALLASAWAVYQLPTESAPTLLAAASLGRPDIASSCWQSYRRGLYLRDTSFDVVSHSQASVHCCAAKDFLPAHRAAIYDRHGIIERLSVLGKDSTDKLLAINLYRFEGESVFTEEEKRSMEAIAPLLLASVRQHFLTSGSDADSGNASIDVRASLKQRCPDLTEREVEVCAALVRGSTFGGIAAELGVSEATAKTYRDRAFRRLGIRYRNELFGLVVSAVAAH